GKSFNKSILFVLGIILVASAFSGCTDVDSPTTLHDEKTLQAILDEDTSMTEIHEKLKPFAESNGYKLNVDYVPGTNQIASIGVISDDDTNYLRFLNTDRNPDVDEIITKDKTLYPTPADDTTVNNYIADGSTIKLDHLVVTNPQTPEAVAVALLSSFDNYDIDEDLEPYLKLYTDEQRKDMINSEGLERATLKQYPDILSMTIDSSEKFEKRGGDFGYKINGNINLEDGKTLQYTINLNENKDVLGLSID
ncbi:MAG: hypothetical protein KAT05_05120, partial [Spirochaetes bacterium]|nr:hypothetical protein [Spirochaetota bacterium]